MKPISQRTDQLRTVPLPAVLRAWGAAPDRHDPHKWHTGEGSLSINGSKFINWKRAQGGGGAIDLVMHLGHCDFKKALRWLQRQFPQHPVDPIQTSAPPRSSLCLPLPAPHQLSRVKDYLLCQRAIPLALVDPLIQAGSLYSDSRANVVFLLRDLEGTPVGAELRGTSARQWRGMAPGSRKNLGFFGLPADCAGAHRPIILCESAIDAISASVLYPDHHCISTSGARPNPAWLSSLIAPTVAIFCGFDADETGDRMARAMMQIHPPVARLRPPFGDWNDLLKSRP
jgi:hypothetical protein